MITPNSLYPGARVAVVCPASTVPEAKLEPGLAFLRELGLEPVVYPSCYFANRHGYFSSPDAQRAKDIQDAFADDTIAGVLCGRGGYGCHRILPLLDLDAIARTPKFFAGYSDVTALHTAFNQTCGFVTYHTPMPTTECATMDPFALHYLTRAMFAKGIGPLEAPESQPMTTLVGGSATGPLCGGNLSLLVSSLGTPWEIDTRGKILFLEDIDETVDRIDALFTHLRNAGKLNDCAGILLGGWTNCDPKRPEFTLTLEAVFQELVVPAGKPTLANLACGHVMPTLSLPLGVRTVMDADSQKIQVAP